MEHKTKFLFICLFFFTLFCIPFSFVLADDDHKERNRNRHRDGDHGNTQVNVQTNPVYKDQCGACHMAYPSKLLPKASWQKILSGLEDHFGESVELDADSKKTIKDFLESNSADHSTSKEAGKIMKCLKTDTPLRITQIPYIRKEHHELHPDLFKRKTIGSFSNCAACHTTSEDGSFDDDNVKIPQ